MTENATIKTELSRLVHTTSFCNNLHQIAKPHKRKGWEAIESKDLNMIAIIGYGYLLLKVRG